MESHRKTRLWVALACACACGLGAGPARADIAAPKRIADKGVITYCMDISFPPLEFFDPETNEAKGFDVDIGKAVAQQMGIKAEFKNISFDGLIPAIQAGQCDAIVSGLFDKPKRREVLDFVDYAYLGNSVIVKSDSPIMVNSLDELTGKRAAVETGTQLEQDLVKANEDMAKAGKPPMKIIALPKASDAFQQLIAGLVDVYYSSTIQAAYYNQQNPGQVKVASPQTTALYIGIATVKPDADLHAAIDTAFKNLVASGGYDKIVKEWKLKSIASHP